LELGTKFDLAMASPIQMFRQIKGKENQVALSHEMCVATNIEDNSLGT